MDVDSPWDSPSFIIAKSDEAVRFLSDFRKVNTKMVRKPYPIPKILDMMCDNMSESPYLYTRKMAKNGNFPQRGFSRQNLGLWGRSCWYFQIVHIVSITHVLNGITRIYGDSNNIYTSKMF